jgi:anti-anti-sigma factor
VHKKLGCEHIILDFSRVTGIDSIVLGHLFMWYHKMQPHHVKLSMRNPSPRIREILEQSHIADIIPIVSSDFGVVNQNGTSQ